MSSTPRPTKNQRREDARERARQEREQLQRTERRRRALLQTTIGVVVVALVAVVAVVIVNSVRPPGPGPLNMANGGITLTGSDFAPVSTGAAAAGSTPTPVATPSGKVLVQVFEDFGCPYCNQFEQANSEKLEALVKSGDADVQYFPVAILDRAFSDRYSTRAANASAAVANWSPASWFDFHSRLYAEQPEEGGAGLSDDRLIAIAKEAGVTHLTEITKAIEDEQFKDWVTARTTEFSSKRGALADADIPAANVGGTPTVLVNGRYYTGAPGDAAAFQTFLTDAQK